MRATAYIAASVDGFIAREDGDLDWLHEAGAPSGEEDYGYRDFMQTVEAIVMGRHTYEKVRTFGGWPYDEPVVVLASDSLTIPPELRDSVEGMSGPPAEVLARLSARGFQHVYVDGGRTIQRFLAAGAIDRLIVTRVPVLIGRGIPLFGPVPADIRLRHMGTRQFNTGVVQSEYVVEAAWRRT
jgi:dihydrofolate reductase